MRVQLTSGPGGALALKAAPRTPEQQRAEAWKTAVQFEKVFVQEMLSGLRKTAELGGEDGGPFASGLFGSGPGSETYTEWFDDSLAEQVVKTGRLGIADQIMEEFERWKQVPPAPPAQPRLPHLDTTPFGTGGIHVLA